MLKKMFFTIIFLNVILLVPISSSKALTSPDFTNLPYSTSATGYVIIGNKSNDTFFAVSTDFDAFRSAISTSNIDGNRFLDLKTNFYGLSSIRSWSTPHPDSSPRIFEYYSYDNSTHQWTKVCDRWGSPATCSYSYDLSINNYVYAFIKGGKSAQVIYTNGLNVNSPLFYVNYNLDYYDTPINYFGTYSNYFSQPTNAKGSSLSFSSDELSASILGFDYSYINTFMYEFSNVDNETTLISHQFNYDSPDLTGNYKLGFVLTHKTSIDSGIVVHAVTNTGTWACNNITPLKNKYDINYQYYVECPSVSFENTDDDFLKIVVNGSNEWYSLVGPVPWYDTNYLFNNANNNKYVGISSILRLTTDEPPVPVTPDTPSEPDINESINNLNNNIMDSSGPDTSTLSQSAGWLPPGPVDSIINMPLSLFNGLLNIFSSNSMCQPITLPIPYLNSEYLQLPCFSSLIASMGFGTWFEGIGLIAGAYILYKYLINLYAWVDKTLTFRENNWQDWGGI